MTLHKRALRMACHYCGLKRPYTETCPICHDSALEEVGKGTERIEEVLRSLFPDVSLARMDADTTQARGAHQRILGAFREGRTQLLVGTQIVAKGHDFPDVHTAVVVSADRGFRIPDFRAAERTYALLVQMAGRAGRGDHPGRVLVQTYKADHYVLSNLKDIERFYQIELRLRSTLRYPPFTRLCLIRVDGVDRAVVSAAAEHLARELRQQARPVPGLGVLGPAPAALPRLVGRWRFQIVLRGEDIKPFRAFLQTEKKRILSRAKKGVRVAIDVDPRNLM
jgi:primosomal protein N' (replication factor Y)